MPNRDGTGPLGDGRPGRGLGNCGKSKRQTSALMHTDKGGIVDIGVALVINLLKNLINRKEKKRS